MKYLLLIFLCSCIINTESETDIIEITKFEEHQIIEDNKNNNSTDSCPPSIIKIPDSLGENRIYLLPGLCDNSYIDKGCPPYEKFEEINEIY